MRSASRSHASNQAASEPAAEAPSFARTRLGPHERLAPLGVGGIVGTIDPSLTPDGSAWASSVLRHRNDLYLVGGPR